MDEQPPAPVVGRPESIPNVQYKILDDADDEDEDADDEAVREAKRRWKSDHPDHTLKEQRRLVATGQIPYEPWMDYMTDPPTTRMRFGSLLPESAVRGDLFVRVDSQPTTLYKFNGESWMEVSKSTTDTYAYDEAYIDYLIGKISAGEYDPELLTDAERGQIESRLKKDLA